MGKTLALDGGTAAVQKDQIGSWPPLTQADRDAVLSVFDNNELHTTGAPKAVELRDRWAAYVGTPHALVCSSGTSALHMALVAASIGPGDEVITSAFSYWSSAAAILHQNAVPVFADIEPLGYTLDPALIESRITEYTRAILPVHIHGMPADMDPINAIAKKHGLVVIEDACQSHGATYKGRKTGSLGDIAAFSCNRSKNLSGGEGGIVTTGNDELAAKLSASGRFGRVSEAERANGDPLFALGWMCRPQEFINALILSQLDRLDEHNAVRRKLSRLLTERLAEIPGFAGPPTPEYADPCYFSYVVTFLPEQLGLEIPAAEWKRAAVRALKAEGASLGQWQTLTLPAMDVFQERVGYGHGCPWTCPFGSGKVDYSPADYPLAQAFVESHAYLGGVHPPNDTALMDGYIAAFEKVSANAARAVELASAAS